ncbi:unnamed protein product, partial [Symbiodinium microadriaticum]
MPSERHTRQPGTPVGDLVARPSSQLASTTYKPTASQSLVLPTNIFCSDSDSDFAYFAEPSPPKSGEKPKPSAAPHIQLAASSCTPKEESLGLHKEAVDVHISLSLPKEDFGGQVNFDFCKQQALPPAHSAICQTQSNQPKSRACAKLLVRSGLRCAFCFCLKSECALAAYMGQASRFRVGDLPRYGDTTSGAADLASDIATLSLGYAYGKCLFTVITVATAQCWTVWPASRPSYAGPGRPLDYAYTRGACTQPYIFDISLLDNRAQPLYNRPHYQPIECMIYDKRPWICFYGGNPPQVVAETDDWWYTMYDRQGGCCLQGWPIFLLQDFMRLVEQPPPSPQPTVQSGDGAGAQPTYMPLPREVMRLPGCLCLPAMILPESYQDITQESLHRSLSAQCMGEYVQSSSESEAGHLRRQAIQNAKPESGPTPADRDDSQRGLHLSVARALLRKSLDKFTAGTLERYIASTRQFLDFLGLSNRTIASLDVAFLADFLHACENSLEEDREVHALQPIMQASLIRAFLTQPTTDRKEALPLPMAVVVAWERYVLQKKPDNIKAITRAPVSNCIAGMLAPSPTYSQRRGMTERPAERLRPLQPTPPLDHGVHEVLYQALALKGLESVDDFAYAFPEIRSLEALLSGLSDSDLSDMGAVDQYHGVQAARIRKALRFAHDLCQQANEPSQAAPQPPSLPAAILPQASPASWVENLPPKLSQEAAQELVADFNTNYPGELLDEDTMPSIRLLSLVQHSLKPGEKIRWIPWQFRLSSKQYTEIMEAKSSKPMRTEAQLLASALYDDTPEMPVAHLRLSASWLSRIQTVYRNAWALCGAAHLNNLKAFDKRVLDLALPDLADNSLRGPTTQELLAADRKIWGTIGTLVSAGWSLDEALYE